MSSKSKASTPENDERSHDGDELRDRIAARMQGGAYARKEAPADFRPTASELEQLAYYWYREWWNLTLSEIHLMGYSEPHARFDDASCINALDDIIGEQAMQIMFEEEIGDEDWAAITRAYNAAWGRFFERLKLEYEQAILRMEVDRREASVRDSRDDKGPEGESQPSE